MFAMRSKTATTAFAQSARTLATLLALCLSVALSPARAQAGEDDEITGYPTVVDGDTLDFGGRAVRLLGIDAPELDQTCRAAGGDWPCGQAARQAAADRVGDRAVACVARGRDVTGAERARCHLEADGRQDLGAWLVREGWALVEPDAEAAYGAAQAAAEAAGRGLWRGSFVAPWSWRLGQRDARDAGAASCSACDARHQRLKRYSAPSD